MEGFVLEHVNGKRMDGWMDSLSVRFGGCGGATRVRSEERRGEGGELGYVPEKSKSN